MLEEEVGQEIAKGFNPLLEKASVLKRKLDDLQAQYDEAIAPVKEYVMDNPDEKIVGFGFTVSSSKGSETVSVDLKALKEAEPDLYEDLVRDYPKKTVRKRSVRVAFDGQ